jgi:hypothetical protein
MESQIERMAVEICAIQRDGMTEAEIDARLFEIAGHLADGTCGPLIDRVGEILRARMAVIARQAEILATIGSLANATNCPDDVSPVAWCLQLGVVEDDEGGYRLTARSRTRVVP